MLNIGFMELMLIGIVALLVLGPDKLPGAIRTGALWVGRAKRSFNQVKQEIEQQINADEIRRQLHNESILSDIDKARKSADKLVKDAQAGIKETEDSIQGAIKPAKRVTPVTSSAEEGTPTPPPETPAADQVAAAVETDESTEPVTGPSAAESTEKEPVQDFYNSPPSGIVSMKDGKFSAVEDKPADADSSPEPADKPDTSGKK